MARERKPIRKRQPVGRQESRLRSLGEFDERDRLPELDWEKIKRAGSRKRPVQRRERRRRGRLAKLRMGVRRWLARLRING